MKAPRSLLLDTKRLKQNGAENYTLIGTEYMIYALSSSLKGGIHQFCRGADSYLEPSQASKEKKKQEGDDGHKYQSSIVAILQLQLWDIHKIHSPDPS